LSAVCSFVVFCKYIAFYGSLLHVGDQGIGYWKRDWEKEMWTAGERWRWDRVGWRRVVCGLCSAGAKRHESSQSLTCACCLGLFADIAALTVKSDCSKVDYTVAIINLINCVYTTLGYIGKL